MEPQDRPDESRPQPPPVSVPPIAQPGSVGPVPQWEDGGFSRLVPTKNMHALIAYYCGVAALIPCLGLVAAVPAIILGVLGRSACKNTPGLPGLGHARAGIIMGSVMIILNVIGIIALVVWS